MLLRITVKELPAVLTDNQKVVLLVLFTSVALVDVDNACNKIRAAQVRGYGDGIVQSWEK
jgi:hypothetical protein